MNFTEEETCWSCYFLRETVCLEILLVWPLYLYYYLIVALLSRVWSEVFCKQCSTCSQPRGCEISRTSSGIFGFNWSAYIDCTFSFPIIFPSFSHRMIQNAPQLPQLFHFSRQGSSSCRIQLHLLSGSMAQRFFWPAEHFPWETVLDEARECANNSLLDSQHQWDPVGSWNMMETGRYFFEVCRDWMSQHTKVSCFRQPFRDSAWASLANLSLLPLFAFAPCSYLVCQHLFPGEQLEGPLCSLPKDLPRPVMWHCLVHRFSFTAMSNVWQAHDTIVEHLKADPSASLEDGLRHAVLKRQFQQAPLWKERKTAFVDWRARLLWNVVVFLAFTSLHDQCTSLDFWICTLPSRLKQLENFYTMLSEWHGCQVLWSLCSQANPGGCCPRRGGGRYHVVCGIRVRRVKKNETCLANLQLPQQGRNYPSRCLRPRKHGRVCIWRYNTVLYIYNYIITHIIKLLYMHVRMYMYKSCIYIYGNMNLI